MIVEQRFKYKVEEVDDLVNTLGLERLSAELLLSRGFNTSESAISFLYPKLSNLPDFMAYTGVRNAVNRIKQAADRGENVIIYGDYDCDGICASSILSQALKLNGIDISVFIPKRLEEGYGLCIETLEKIAEEYFPDLIITVDCGITSVDEVEYCRNELGIDVIVTDHHEPPEILPDCIIINPHLDKEFYVDFCGAGVAFMLVRELYGIEFACKFIDIAAVATLGDIVPLTTANRTIVKYGIKKLIKNPNYGLKLLMENLNIKNEITSQDISFKIVPRINSLGRLGDASRAVALFTETDHFILTCLIKEMNDENAQRQQLCLSIEKEGEKLSREYINEERGIVLCGDWHKGVLGIAASKLVEKFNRPVILFTRAGNELNGSCRSIPEINIYEILSKFKHLFSRFGGHSQAAGITMSVNNYNEFKKEFLAYLKIFPNEVFLKRIEYDVDITGLSISQKFFDELKLFEPFGNSNSKPIFRFKLREGNFIYNKNNPAHINWQTKFGYQITGFFKGEYLHYLNSTAKKDCFLSLSKNLFNGKEYCQAVLDSVILTCAPCVSDKTRECLMYAKTATGLNKNIKVLDKSEFYKILIESFKLNPYGNIAVCFTLESYMELRKLLIDNELKFEEYYSIKNSENTLNSIIYSPQIDCYGWYDNCFFVDKPMCCPQSESTNFVTVKEECSLKDYLCELKLDRNKLGDWFIKIRKLLNESTIRNLIMAESALAITEQKKLEFYTAWLIFEEINLILYDKEKKAFSINNIRTDLTNSSLYCIINGNG